MTTLTAQIEKVEREVEFLCASAETRTAIDEVESALGVLEGSFGAWLRILMERDALAEFPDIFQFEDVLEPELVLRNRVIELYKLAAEAWENDRTRIKQSGTVGALADALVDCEKLVRENNKRVWIEWANSVASDFAISDAELDSIINVPAYTVPIQKFKEGREKFSLAIQEVPNNSVQVGRLTELARSLHEIKGGLEFKLPKFVMEFFNTLNRDGTYPLSKLSVELSDWLSENDELRNLSITRRGIPRY